MEGAWIDSSKENGVVRGCSEEGEYEQVILYIPKPLIPLLIVGRRRA
jgi:hypothetical protein